VLFYLFFAAVVIYLVGKIARKYERFVTDSGDRLVQREFSPFAPNKYSSRLDVTLDVGAYGIPRLKLNVLFAPIVLDVGFPAALEPFHTHLQPGNTSFHEAYTQVWKLIEDPVKNNTRESNHESEWMTKGVDGRERCKVIHS